MEHTPKKQNMTNLAVLLVFTVFAACILMVLLSGANLYRRLTERDQHSYGHRTAAQYITTRVRQADSIHTISVEDFEGINSLVLHQEIDSEHYETRVYCWEGYIRELFTPTDSGLSPEDGEKLVEATALTFHLTGCTLSVELIYTDGCVQPLTLFLRSREEAP